MRTATKNLGIEPLPTAVSRNGACYLLIFILSILLRYQTEDESKYPRSSRVPDQSKIFGLKVLFVHKKAFIWSAALSNFVDKICIFADSYRNFSKIVIVGKFFTGKFSTKTSV